MTGINQDFGLGCRLPRSSGISAEAEWVLRAVEQAQDRAGSSLSLFWEKAGLLADLRAMMQEGELVAPGASSKAEQLIRALPVGIPLPEVAPEPDGSISFDWIASRLRSISVSVGESARLAYAWVDGSESGHAVAWFDGEAVPEGLLDEIRRISGPARDSA
ncbi:MAG: hypothetical protein IPK72_23085 [Candidatus Eisenbacteria bacterium]|nr:hypothetical protein [Candidatus Eisenbacteria bacterium]